MISQIEAFRIISGESIDEVRITKRSAKVRVEGGVRGDSRTGTVRRKRGETVAEMLVRAVESAFTAPTDYARFLDAMKRAEREAPKRKLKKAIERTTRLAMRAPASGMPC